MFDELVMRTEIAQRRRVRIGEKVSEQSKYVRFCNDDGRRPAVMAEVLAEIRSERVDPDWRPGGPLNGGYYMESRIQKKLRQMYREWLARSVPA